MSLVGFPLLLIPLAIINIIVFLMPGVSFGATLLSLPLMSGAVWKATLGDALLALGLVLLLCEVIKASRPNGRYLTDHLLSFLTLAATVAEFVLLSPFATSVFFLLAVMMAVDFIAGVSLRLRRERLVAGRTAAQRSRVAPDAADSLPPPEPKRVPPVPVPASAEPIVPAVPAVSAAPDAVAAAHDTAERPMGPTDPLPHPAPDTVAAVVPDEPVR